MWLDLSAVHLLIPALGILGLLHLIQVFSPMRLDIDATGYLGRTVAIVEGRDLGWTWLPPGYSYFLAGLEFLGIGNAWTFALLNWVFASVGLGATYYLLRRELALTQNSALTICSLTLLSFLFVKYLPMPLAEGAYFGLSMVVLSLLSRLRQGWHHPVVLLLVAAALALVAILTRTIGVSIAAGFVGVALYQYRSAPRNAKSAADSRIELVTIVFGVLFAAAAAGFLVTSRYATETGHVFGVLGAGEALGRMVDHRLRNWGELFLNAPRSVVPAWFGVFLYPAGLLAIALVFVGMLRSRRRWGPVEAYFAAYFVALIIYPGPQTRYWLPVLPLMLGWTWLAIRPFSSQKLTRWAVAVYLCGFTIAGLGALAYSTRITFSGSAVGDVYGDGTLSPAYDAVYRGTPLPNGEKTPHAVRRAIILLRRYDPRALDVPGSLPRETPEEQGLQ